MAKSRRGKSASINELSKWESELIQAPFNEVRAYLSRTCMDDIQVFEVLQLLKQAYIRTMAEFVYRFLHYQETWKSCVFFIAPNKLEDNFLIDVLSEVVATGLRKLFSIVTFDGLLKDVSFSENFDSSFPLFFRNDQARY